MASGEPDVRFGYLDSEINVFTGPLMRQATSVLLGTRGPASLAPGYVALMPGLGWLPHAWGATYRPATRGPTPPTYFEVELEVEVPAGWLVAGPGRRETLEGDNDTARFRFRPGAPVPHVGLLASRFAAARHRGRGRRARGARASDTRSEHPVLRRRCR